jgi:hypothetical protein
MRAHSADQRRVHGERLMAMGAPSIEITIATLDDAPAIEEGRR